VDVRQLRYALALAEHQHFGRAAAAVGIAQPPLSKAIAQLEREVGARLFDRTRQGVFPTAAGDAPEGPTSPRAIRETAIRHEAATRCLSVTISH